MYPVVAGGAYGEQVGLLVGAALASAAAVVDVYCDPGAHVRDDGFAPSVCIVEALLAGLCPAWPGANSATHRRPLQWCTALNHAASNRAATCSANFGSVSNSDAFSARLFSGCHWGSFVMGLRGRRSRPLSSSPHEQVGGSTGLISSTTTAPQREHT